MLNGAESRTLILALTLLVVLGALYLFSVYIKSGGTNGSLALPSGEGKSVREILDRAAELWHAKNLGNVVGKCQEFPSLEDAKRYFGLLEEFRPCVYEGRRYYLFISTEKNVFTHIVCLDTRPGCEEEVPDRYLCCAEIAVYRTPSFKQWHEVCG